MKQTLIRLMALLLSLSSVSFAEDISKKVCVLNFETPQAPQTKMIAKVMAGKPGVTIYDLARPVDLVTCVRERFEEILIVGHALITSDNRKGKKPVNLGFFLNLTGEDRQQAIVSAQEYITHELETLEADPSFRQNDPDSQDNAKMAQYRHFLSLQKKLNNYKDSDPYYVVRPILPNAIMLARQELDKQAGEPGGVSLKTIRLLSCLPEQVLAQYDDLRGMIEDHKIMLEVAPKSKFWSFIEGMTVTNPRPGWLAEGL